MVMQTLFAIILVKYLFLKATTKKSNKSILALNLELLEF